MTALAMALAGHNRTLGPQTAVTPGTMNKWLQTHHGYKCIGHDCNNLNLTAVTALPGVHSLGEITRPSLAVLKQWVRLGWGVLAHVKENRAQAVPHHFVLLTGFFASAANSTFAVNDGYYTRSFYDFDLITDVIVYRFEEPRSLTGVFGADLSTGATLQQLKCLQQAASPAQSSVMSFVTVRW